MTAWILSTLWKPIAAFIGLLAVFWAGGRNARLKAKAEAGEEYARKRRAIDEALETLGDDPAVLRDYLRVRGERTE